MSPNPLSFGKTGIDVATKVRRLMVSNVAGKKSLSVAPDALAASFSIVSPIGPFVVQPLHSVLLKLGFAPTVTGHQQETLTLHSSDPKHPTVLVTLSGKGRPGEPSVPMDSLSFGHVGIGVAPNARTIKLTNSGLGRLTGTVGTLGAPFTVTVGAGAFDLLPGQKWTVTVQFAPVAVVHSATTLVITTDDPAIPVVNLEVSGTGAPGHLTTNLPTLPDTITPVLDFGPSAPATSVTKVFKIVNSGEGVLQGSVGTPTNGTLVVTGGSGAFALEPGGRQAVTVKFTPTGSGKFKATLPITVTPPGTPASGLTVSLKGTGT